MHAGVPLTFALGAALAALAVAVTAPAAPSATPTVSELVVTPEKLLSELQVVAPKDCLSAKPEPSAPLPRVVGTYPPLGGKVRPGILIVRVTFDRPMTCAGFLARDMVLPDPCPDDRQDVRLSYDRRTIWTVCLPRPNQRFAIWLNPDRNGPPTTQTNRFQSLAGRPLEPYRLVFETSDGPLVTTAADAMAQDPETSRRQKP